MSGSETKLDRRQLRRETRTALELAIAALAPPGIVDGLAAVTAILEALEELPPEAAPVRATSETIVARGRIALDAWRVWRASRGLDGG